MAAAQAQPALVWPDQMPEPMTNYVGRRVSAFGLKVTGVDADEGFWVQKGDRRAWVQLETSTESPYTVRVGDTVSLSGRVLPHDPNFPSQIMFCPDRTASRAGAVADPDPLRGEGGRAELRDGLTPVSSRPAPSRRAGAGSRRR